MKDRVHDLSSKEFGIVLIKTTAVNLGIIVLFYRSVWAIVLFPFLLAVMLKQEKKKISEERKNKTKEEFIHGMNVLNGSLQAGLSMENAWKEVEKEMKYLYGETSNFYVKLKEMNQRVANNLAIEKLFLDFAYTSRIEEIIQFAELLEYGKRSGSNWKKIIDVTVNQMTERYEARQQIEVMVAEKKMEQRIMNILPLGMLAFLQFSAWDYMSVLYHNAFGIICMTVFLIAYMGAIGLSERILRVQI